MVSSTFFHMGVTTLKRKDPTVARGAVGTGEGRGGEGIGAVCCCSWGGGAGAPLGLLLRF